MTAYLPSPFPRKGVTKVQLLSSFRIYGFSRPWGGPAGG